MGLKSSDWFHHDHIFSILFQCDCHKNPFNPNAMPRVNILKNIGTHKTWVNIGRFKSTCWLFLWDTISEYQIMMNWKPYYQRTNVEMPITPIFILIFIINLHHHPGWPGAPTEHWTSSISTPWPSANASAHVAVGGFRIYLSIDKRGNILKYLGNILGTWPSNN